MDDRVVVRKEIEGRTDILAELRMLSNWIWEDRPYKSIKEATDYSGEPGESQQPYIVILLSIGCRLLVCR